MIVSDTENTDGKIYLAIGYPNSKNKNKEINRTNTSVTPHLFSYSSTIKQNSDLCQKLKISGNEHLFLNYNSKYSKDTNGLKINSISPKGISGRALIDMGNITQIEQYETNVLCNGKLTGLLIENHQEYCVMCAVKISVITQAIQASA